jgi:hypothetical protein
VGNALSEFWDSRRQKEPRSESPTGGWCLGAAGRASGVKPDQINLGQHDDRVRRAVDSTVATPWPSTTSRDMVLAYRPLAHLRISCNSFGAS